MKKTITLALALTAATSLAACGKQEVPAPSEEAQPTDKTPEVDVTVPEATDAPETNKDPDSLQLTKPQTVAFDFVSALQTGDYEKAMTYLNIEDNSFVSAKDLEWFVPRSDFADVVDTDYALVSASSSELDNVNELVALNMKPLTLEVSVSMNDNNEWKVNFNDFVVSNWMVKVPKGLKLKIGDKEVDSKYLEKKEDHSDYYKIPAIVSKEIDLILSSSTYGDSTAKVIPTAEEFAAVFELSDEKAAELSEKAKKMFNDISVAYENGETNYNKFVSDKANPSVVTVIANSIKEAYTWNDGLDPWNIRFSKVTPTSEYKGEPCVSASLVEEGIINFNFKAEKTWDNTKYDTDSESVRLYGNMLCVEDGDSLKMFDISADNFLAERNSMSSDW